MKIYIVIPAYNEEKTIGKVLTGLKSAGYDNLVVVDDGSNDKTYEIATNHNAIVLRHILNRGLGGALSTGIKAAIKRGAEIIVTFDADDQHSGEDIKKITQPVEKKEAEVVIGSRLLDPKGMPFFRRILNQFGNIATFILFGIWVTDSQSGLRAFSRKAAEKIDIKTSQMEVSSEIIREIGMNQLKLKEVPIQAIYTDYSLSKGQNLFVGIKTFIKLIMHRLMH